MRTEFVTRKIRYPSSDNGAVQRQLQELHHEHRQRNEQGGDSGKVSYLVSISFFAVCRARDNGLVGSTWMMSCICIAQVAITPSGSVSPRFYTHSSRFVMLCRMCFANNGNNAPTERPSPLRRPEGFATFWSPRLRHVRERDDSCGVCSCGSFLRGSVALCSPALLEGAALSEVQCF